MTVVRAICANGDRHIGELDWWWAGQASIAGHIIRGVVLIDAVTPGSGGPARGTSAALTAERRPLTHRDGPPAAASHPAGPTGVFPINNSTPEHGQTEQQLANSGVSGSDRTDGQGTRSGLSGCRCGHSRHEHGPYLHCRHVGCRCDVYRSKTNAAALASDGVLEPLQPSTYEES